MIKLSYVAFLLILISGCKKASTETPAYIHCKTASVAPNNFGDNSSNIYGLHVTINNDDRGNWQMEFLMPVLSEGIQNVLFYPVVKKNNLSTLFTEYPMYKFKVVPLNLVRRVTIDTNIQFEYADDVKSLCQETFEVKTNFSASSVSSRAKTGNSSMTIIADYATLDTTTIAYYNTPPIVFNPTKNTYLEFDYLMPKGACAPCLSYTNSSGNIVNVYGQNFLTPNSDWVHVYYDLQYIIARASGQTSLTPTFILTPDKNNTTAQIFIDNLKIIEK